MRSLFRKLFLITLFGALLSGVSYAVTMPVELEVPDYFNDGDHCPDTDTEQGIALMQAYLGSWGVANFNPLSHTFLCGRSYSVQPDDPDLVSDGFKKPGEPIKGVFLATYEENLSGELRATNVQVYTNGEGEYMLPIKKFKANTYLGVFCLSKDGQQKYLVDLFRIQNIAKSSPTFDLGLPCREFQVTPEMARATIAPEPLGYVDESNFLQCGVDRVGGAAEGPASDKTANFSFYVTESVDYYNGQTFTLEDVEDGDVPPELTVLTPEEIEGRHTSKYYSDETRGALAADRLFNPGYSRQRVLMQDEGQTSPLPVCSTLLEAYSPVSLNGDKEMSYGNTAGLAAGMMMPGQIKLLFDAIPSAVKDATDVCINNNGSTRKLSSFSYGDKDFPYQRVLEVSGNLDLSKNLATNRQKYLGTSDSAYNFGDGAGEYCRQAFAVDEDIANTPFKACSDIVKPYVNEVDYLLGPSVNAGNNFAFPGSTLMAQAVGGGIAPTIQRIGIGQKHCTCSTLEGGECNYPEPAYVPEGHPTASGYKITTENVADPNTFYNFSLFGALSNIFLNVTAKFNVGQPNLDEAIENGNECVPVTGEQVVDSCVGHDDCHQVCDPPNSTNCYYAVNEYTYSCNGTVGVAINTETVIQGTSGDGIGYTTQAINNMFSMPYLARNAIGGVGLSQSTLTNGGSNTQEINYGMEGPVQATYNTDQVRFAKRLPKAYGNEPLLPIMMRPVLEEEISGICEPDSFVELIERSTLPVPYSYVGDVPIPPYNDIVADAYAYAEEETGVPCLILAGIHFREGGNNEYQSVKDGTPTSDIKESAKNAAIHFRDISMPAAGKSSNPSEWTIEDIIAGLSFYNFGGNQQCQWQGYDPVLTTYTNCPEFYEGEDDLYVMNDFAPRYGNMSLIYPGFGGWGIRADYFCAAYPGPCPWTAEENGTICETMWNQCPTPLEYPGNPGALTASFFFLSLLGVDPNGL